MIAKSTIEKVFESSRVEEVLGDFVQLKKSGSNYKGLSPFTEEKTPSFMVSPAKLIWKDFSSGKGDVECPAVNSKKWEDVELNRGKYKKNRGNW